MTPTVAQARAPLASPTPMPTSTASPTYPFFTDVQDQDGVVGFVASFLDVDPVSFEVNYTEALEMQNLN